MSATPAAGKQKIWGWRVTASLFLAGAAAGSYLVGFLLGAAYEETSPVKMAVPAAAILAALGIAFMLWHMGRKANSILAFSRPRTSWISRGAIALAVLFVLAVVGLIVWLAGGDVLGAAHLVVGVVNSIVACFVLGYTGMLLRSLRPIALWNSVLLPVLFVLSGMTTGLMIVAVEMGIDRATGATAISSAALMPELLLGFIVAEAVVLGLFLWRVNRGDSAASAKMILSGPLAFYHWVGVVVIGLLIPLILCANFRQPSAAALIVVGVEGLVGNAVLRYVIVAAGSRKALDVAGNRVAAPLAGRMTVSQYLEQVRREGWPL